MRRTSLVALAIGCALSLQVVNADEVVGLTTFTSGTPARASEVNANFQAVKTAVDDNDARIDALQTSLGGTDANVAALEETVDELAATLFGDGSAGDLVVTGTASWLPATDATSPNNLSFDDCTIPSGTTLIVAAGTTIRCAGTFTNEGSILVATGTTGGTFNEKGMLRRLAMLGDLTSGAGPEMPTFVFANTALGNTYSGVSAGGAGGAALTKMFILSNLSQLRTGGSSGTGRVLGTGGAGGGLIRILVGGALSNVGVIRADGNTGSGGGGGGIVILVSGTTLTHTGSITARGGSGSSSNNHSGASGGGGGGVVVMLAPSIHDSGTVDVSGGAAGSATTQVIGGGVYLRGGGGGGGSSGGVGGGGSVLESTPLTETTPAVVTTAAEAGAPGRVLLLQQNPRQVLH